MSELEKLPDVAKKIHVYCRKCESERYHVVLAHTSSSAAKLECEVCKGKKTYKINTGLSAGGGKKKVTSRARTRKKGPSAAEKWSDLKAQVDLAQIQPYNMRNNYASVPAIDHPKFGLGIVTNVSTSQIEVVFEDGEKALVHNRG